MLLLLALQQAVAFTTPPSGDTVGYWQQRADYSIVARLDEALGGVRARADLWYTNNSPDTLREMYVHQYLNAFRPHSRWSAVDEREGRVRFQHLEDPDYAYERFTAPVSVRYFDGETSRLPVRVDYPDAPDSTVAHFALPRVLAPGASLLVHFEWDARPSTVPRRQGRRGRSFDFAQWYPKVAVYDRGGWEANPLVPAGEFYGEFGSYDVTLIVPDDQVIGASGVLAEGDPGWTRALKWGAVHETATAYVEKGVRFPGDSIIAPSEVAAGYKAVRFGAQDVHHFAWSASPDYRYEGGVYVRAPGARAEHFPVWDTVAINVLYRPGDEEQWGSGQVVERAKTALAWLERVYGPYAWPQLTALHRIEPGGTEFPMVMMNGSASQGLILHEGGHMFTYGILANNEWRSGWMDEGLSDYQTAWFSRATAQDRPSRPPPPRAAQRGAGYAARAVRPTGIDAVQVDQYRLDLLGRAEPIGRAAQAFREFGIYNAMVYTRAELMYGQLRDALGDSAFAAFLHDYYDRWALKHVDELAMRRSAERACACDLGWFFDEWVHRTGLIDYALTRVRERREGKGWLTRARVTRRGEYRHPVPVGVRSAAGWRVVRADPLADAQTVEVRTDARPLEVRLDPFRTTEDWDRRNDVAPPSFLDALLGRRPRLRGRDGPRRTVFDWPLLDQYDREHEISAFAPIAWYTAPGGVAVGFRARSSYQGLADRAEYGAAFLTRRVAGSELRDVLLGQRLQQWGTFENPRLGRRPIVGLGGGSWDVDGVSLLEVHKAFDTSPFIYARGPRSSWTLRALGAFPYDTAQLPEEWTDAVFGELGLERRVRTAGGTLFRAAVGGGVASEKRLEQGLFGFVGEGWLTGGYGRADGEVSRRAARLDGRAELAARGYAAYSSPFTPLARRAFLASDGPVATLANHWYRPRDALLKRARYTPLGGAGLRGYDPRLAVRSVAAVNLEGAVRLPAHGGVPAGSTVWGTLFADAGWPLERDAASDLLPERRLLGDAGLGLKVRGRVYDRSFVLRLDFPLYVSEPALAYGSSRSGDRVAPRVTWSLEDLW